MIGGKQNAAAISMFFMCLVLSAFPGWANSSRLLIPDLKISADDEILRPDVSLDLNPPENPWMNLKKQEILSADFVGTMKATAIAADDFNDDGAPDLIAAYEGTVSRIALFAGNTSTQRSMKNQQSPFLPGKAAFELPAWVDRLFTGDFSADDHIDIVATKIGTSTLFWVEGNGHGQFGNVHTLTLEGKITAIASGEMNRPDLLADLVVATDGPAGPQILVFESPLGALTEAPEILRIAESAAALAIGQLDDSYESDLAVAAGNQVLIIHGRDRRLSQGNTRKAKVLRPKIDAIAFQYPLLSIAAGNFLSDNRSELAVSDVNGALILMQRSGSQWIKHDVSSPAAVSNLSAARIAIGPHQALIGLDQHGKLQALSFNGARFSTMEFQNENGSTAAVLPMRLNGDGLEDLVLLKTGRPDAVMLLTVPALALIVNSTLDAADAAINGVCDDGAGHCTLRAAIQEANAVAGSSTISFNIAGTGPFTIAPATALPIIVRPILIDGTTQPGVIDGSWPPSLLIELNATGTGGVGLQIDNGGSSSFITGLVINRAPTRGILINSSNNNIVRYNFIGTDVSGTIALPNHSDGVRVLGASNNNSIGGVSEVQRNLISGNSGGNGGVDVIGGPTNTIVQGNFIGTDITGLVALPNSVVANVVVAFNVTGTIVGAAFPSTARNIIAAGNNYGIIMQGSVTTAPDVTGTIVAGNFIGLDVTGTAALGNNVLGINILTANSNTFGGVTAGAGNVISANGGTTFQNILFQGTTNQDNLIQGNYIGTDATGSVGLGTTPIGIGMITGSGTVIGGTVPGARNVISNAEEGIELQGSASDGNFFMGNYIGLNASGNAAIPNSDSGIALNPSSNNVIGGEDFGTGNVISGNGGAGIFLGGLANLIQGNLIGTDAAGAGAIPNNEGIRDAGFGTLIGGSTATARNVISGNSSHGVALTGQGTIVLGNFIGTGAGGTSAVGNGQSGISSPGSGRIGGRLPGEGNIIAYNGSNGVAVSGSVNHTPIIGNSIYNNQQIGIDLNVDGVSPNDPGDGDGNANQTQNFPVLDQVLDAGGETIVTGTLNSIANSTFAIDLFSSPTCDSSGNGQGKNYLGSTSVTTDASGNGSFTADLSATPIPGYVFAATATDSAGNTSEFSGCSCFVPALNPTSNSPVCSGQTLQLSVNNVAGASYNWSGPNGFQSFIQNPIIPNATASNSGLYHVSVNVLNCSSTSADIPVVVNPAPALFPPSLPDTTIGAAYNQSFSAVGGSGPFVFSVAAGSLPPGLTLTPAGLLSGAASATGTYDFVVAVSDANSCGASLSYTIHVNCGSITISPAGLPQIKPNVAYSVTITATGGVTPYNFAVTAGSLPAGITLNPSTGELAGVTTDSGTFTFTITVNDAIGCAASIEYDLSGCLFCDDFEDGVLNPNWTYSGTWNESGGSLVANAAGGTAFAMAAPVFSGCSNCSMEAMLLSAGGSGNKLSFFGWYTDSQNSVELQVKQAAGKLIFKQRAGGSIVAKAKGSATINPNVFYDVRMLFDGTDFQVFLDNTLLFTVPAGATPNGTVAFQVKNTTAQFDNVVVN